MAINTRHTIGFLAATGDLLLPSTNTKRTVVLWALSSLLVMLVQIGLLLLLASNAKCTVVPRAPTRLLLFSRTDHGKRIIDILGTPN